MVKAFFVSLFIFQFVIRYISSMYLLLIDIIKILAAGAEWNQFGTEEEATERKEKKLANPMLDLKIQKPAWTFVPASPETDSRGKGYQFTNCSQLCIDRFLHKAY